MRLLISSHASSPPQGKFPTLLLFLIFRKAGFPHPPDTKETAKPLQLFIMGDLVLKVIDSGRPALVLQLID